MGAFQGVAAGLGSAGEDIGKGANDALTQALRVQAQEHAISHDDATLALAQAGQTQQYNLAQQNHEFQRQNMLNQGWTHAGTTYDNGQYYQVYNNPRTGESSRIPYQGTPPDSPEGTLRAFHTLSSAVDDNGNRLFTDRQVKEKVLGLHDLYRTDPAGVVSGFREEANDLFENQGIPKVRVPGFGQVDISTPKGQADYGQMMSDSYWGKGSFLRAAMGFGPGKQVDTTGWTKQEMNEYNGLAQQTDKLEQLYTELAKANMATVMDPTGKQQRDVQADLMSTMQPMWAQLEAKRDEINGRHGRINPNATNKPGQGAPAKGAYRIGNVWYDATSHTPLPNQGTQPPPSQVQSNQVQPEDEL
jgi:hypothetical protein